MKFYALFLNALFFFTFLSAGEFEEIAASFSKQVEQGVGVIPDCSLTDPSIRRNGPVLQKAIFENSSQCTLQITFPFLDKFGKEHTATAQRRFFLKDFVEGGSRRFEVNHKTLTLSLQDPLTKWNIGFRSSVELTRAASLFSRLIALGETKKDLLLPSQAAYKAGFRSLIICPIQPNLPDGTKSTLSFSKTNSYMTFLSRSTVEEETKLLEAAENRLPLFVYDIQKLDTSLFYAIPSPDTQLYIPFSVQHGVQQSILSDDRISLFEDMKMKEVYYIHFITCPTLDEPTALLYPPHELNNWKKTCKTNGISTTNTNFCEMEPLYWNNRIPGGTDSFWLISSSPRCDDVLRFLFENQNKKSTEHILTFVRQSYPNVQLLLKQKSRYFKDHTIEEAICKNFEQLQILSPHFSHEQMRVLKIALICHEMGSQLGPLEELSYNSLPFALMLAEKVDCSEKEMRMLELLLQQSPINIKETSTEPSKIPTVQDLFKATLAIAEEEISPAIFLPIQETFLKILLSNDTQQPHLQLSSLLAHFNTQTLASLCFGLHPFQGVLPARKIYSSYMWEVRDPLHRDGIYLKRAREKFEQLVLEDPQSSWKGKFWQWLDAQKSKKPHASTLYLNEEQKEQYRALFKDGKLYSNNGKIIASQEVMFVLDTHNHMYVGQKKDATEPGDFSLNHASFTAGKPVASSGKIGTDAEGHPILLRNVSGHYRPKIYETTLALQFFQAAGIDINKMLISIKDDPVEQLPKMKGDRFLSLFQNATP